MQINKSFPGYSIYRIMYIRGAEFPAAIADPPFMVGLLISNGPPTIWFIAFCPGSEGTPVICSTATACTTDDAGTEADKTPPCPVTPGAA